MKDIRLESASAPFTAPGPGALAARVIAFAGTTGLLDNVDVRALDLPTWNRVVERLRRLDIGKFKAPAVARNQAAHAKALTREIEAIYAAIEASPMPSSEWRSMRALLKDELLERLLGVSRQSIQRYAAGERDTPQDVAERLHAIALIASDLAGSYNEFGIRRWFERPRAQLSGKSPAAILHGDWNPEASLPRRIRDLAAELSGVKAT